VFGATVLISIIGFSLAITMWAPFALVRSVIHDFRVYETHT
jgi:hypothetical protein